MTDFVTPNGEHGTGPLPLCSKYERALRKWEASGRAFPQPRPVSTTTSPFSGGCSDPECPRHGNA